MQENRFTIIWSNLSTAYRVSIPNYDGGEVVKATYHDNVVRQLSSLLLAAGLPQHFIDEAIKQA